MKFKRHLKLFIPVFLWSVCYLNAQTYQNADVPDIMTFINGSKVKSEVDWEKRKKEIKKIWCDYFIGHYPKEVPKLVSAEIITTEKRVDGSTRKRVVLAFDTPNKNHLK